MKNFDKLKKVIACPDCHGVLTYSDKSLECHGCGKIFPIRYGIPILFNSKSEFAVSKEANDFYENYDDKSMKLQLKKYFSLPNFIVARPTLHDRLRDSYIFNALPDSSILNFGSGVQNVIDHPALVNFDIYPHANADIVGDGHFLPFLDESMDGVWLCAVLEHLKRPFDVADEVFRVLKKDGFVLIAVPFMQPRHGSPADFFRYTLDGIRSVFSKFKEIEGGVTGKGPIGTWAEMTVALAGGVIENKAVSYAIRFFVGWVIYPLALVDKLMVRKISNPMIFGGVCYLGKKR
jgi:uncharacterized protein YbaR (Trm112 family)/SAM-dependent methyltransferase